MVGGGLVWSFFEPPVLVLLESSSALRMIHYLSVVECFGNLRHYRSGIDIPLFHER